MKTRKIPVFLILFCLIPSIAFANSSWHWISETRPYDVLPFVIVLTLLIETISVIFAADLKEVKFKVFIVVLIGNLLSFSAPYISAATDINYSFRDMLEHFPVYTVDILYLLVTLIIEIPFVYAFLAKNAESGRKLFLSILISNAVTTLLTSLAERIFCYGKW